MSSGRITINNNNKKKRPNQNKKNTSIAVFIILAIVLIGVIFAIMQVAEAVAPTRFVSIPLVETVLISDEGTTHSFDAQVMIEIDSSAEGISQEQLYREVFAAISSLSYEEITGFNGMENVRGAVRSRLSHSFDEGDLVGVFITDIQSDISLPGHRTDDVPQRNNFFDAIFGAGN